MISWRTGRLLLLVTLMMITVFVIATASFIGVTTGTLAEEASSFGKMITAVKGFFDRSTAEDVTTVTDNTAIGEPRILGATDTSIRAFPTVQITANPINPFTPSSDVRSDEADPGEGNTSGSTYNPVGTLLSTEPAGVTKSDTTSATDQSNGSDDTDTTTGVVAGVSEVNRPVITRTAPEVVKAGQALELHGSGFDSANNARFVGPAGTIDLHSFAAVDYRATVNIPLTMAPGTYQVTVKSRTGISDPFTVTVIER